MQVIGGQVNRDELLERLASEIDALNGRIKVIARRRADDGVALSELRAEKSRLENHRASLLRTATPENGEGRL